MAANKFATTLQQNTNRITLILVYAFLEWTLIALLLLNSLFSYLIVKFADYFGLKRPCLWCSRLDHFFEPQRSDNCPRDLVCEAHAKEISGLEYCPSHRRLAESRDLCEDCCSVSASASEADEWSKRFAFFPWTKQIGVISGKEFLESESEEEYEEEENSKCSCCGASLSAKRFAFNPCILIKPPSWGVLDYPQKKGLVEDDDQTFEADISDHSRSDFIADHREEDEEHSVEVNRLENEAVEDEKNELVGKEVKVEEDYCCFTVKSDQVFDEQSKEENGDDDFAAAEIPAPHLEFVIGQEDCELIPIIENQNQENYEANHNDEEDKKEEEAEDRKGASSGFQDVILDFETDLKTRDESVNETWLCLGETLLELVSPTETRSFQPVLVSQGTQTVSEDDSDFLDLRQVSDADEEEDDDGEISIGTEIPDYEQVESCSYTNPCEQEDPSSTTNCIDLHFNCNYEEDVEGSESEESPRSREGLRAALRAVYAELEEERSAAAVAASQTMAMINRLQEEKAAVLMEAVQYRRVMEEQSEYHRSLLFCTIDASDSDEGATPEDAVLHCTDTDDDGFPKKGHYRGPGNAKRLLPLFDAAGDDDMAEEEEEEEEEEFLRRCLQKGDEGLGMLTDILRQLRKLRTVEQAVVLERVFS